MLKLSALGNVRLFRNNTGMGWTGKKVVRRKDHLIIFEPRPLHAGLIVGSSDLIGYTTVTITPDMVGTKLSVFTAIEVKSDTGRATDEQKRFIDNVKKAGGFAGVARTPDEALKIIEYPATQE